MVFRARDQMGREAAVSVSNKALALRLTLPALALGAGIPGVILAQAVAGVAALGWRPSSTGSWRAPPLQLSPPERPASCSRRARPILAMTAATPLQPYLDAILLSKLAPAAVVGWFGAAQERPGDARPPPP